MTRFGIVFLYVAIVAFVFATVSNLGRLSMSGLYPVFAFAIVGFIMWYTGWKKVEFRNNGETTDDIDAEFRRMLDTDTESR